MKRIETIIKKSIAYAVLCLMVLCGTMFAILVNSGTPKGEAARMVTQSVVRGTKADKAIGVVADYTEVETSTTKQLRSKTEELQRKLEEKNAQQEELQRKLEEAQSHEGWFHKAKKSIKGWFASKACGTQ